MRWHVRLRELLVITLLTLVVVGTMSLAHLLRLSELGVQEAVRRAQTELREISVVAQVALSRHPGVAPVEALEKDDALQALLAAVVAHAPDVVYLRVERPDGTLLADGIPGGGPLPETDSLTALLERGSLDRLWTLLFREGRVLETDLALELEGAAFARVRLGTDTSLLRADLQRVLAGSAGMGVVALALSWVVALIVTALTRAPLRRLGHQIERLRAGDYELEQDAWDVDFVTLAAQLRGLGAEIRSERLALLAEKRTLQDALDHLQDGILLVDEDDAILFYNRAVAGLLGCALQEALGSELDELLPASHPLVRATRRVRQGEGLEHARVSIPSESRFREARLSAWALGARESGEGVLVLLEDLSGLRALQDLVEYSARVTEVGRMTAGMAHEVRNPLNSMSLNLALLEERVGDDPEAARSLRLLERAVASLDRIVEGLLDYLRPTTLEKVEVDADDLVRELAAFFEAEAAEKGVQIELDLAAGEERIEADPHRLHQVFVNLIQNAFDAMPKGGRLRLRTALEPDWLLVTVEDTGSGIDPEDHERIFHLYYTTRAEGSGIGLPMVHRIVREHDGSIAVHSRPGEGARFEVRLPRRTPHLPPEPTTEAEAT